MDEDYKDSIIINNFLNKVGDKLSRYAFSVQAQDGELFRSINLDAFLEYCYVMDRRYRNYLVDRILNNAKTAKIKLPRNEGFVKIDKSLSLDNIKDDDIVNLILKKIRDGSIEEDYVLKLDNFHIIVRPAS
ncbi:hypothetical protein ACMXYX_18010 (plasmid) [Neptuniibacter sp. QD72_48]|uniref:hypothetical protein n=1 Tax=Neptuniibacter sp. QD72_48 TaxID=3398214 RepID=UPI0039F5A124